MKLVQGVQKVALAVAVCAVTTGAMAANQGSVGSTSEGDFDVTYNKGADVRIWGLQDVSFDGDTNDITTQDLTESYTFCTYSNNTTEVVFDVESNNGSFTLDPAGGSAAGSLPYRVALADQGGSVLDTWGNAVGVELPSGAQGYERYATQSTSNGSGSNVCGGGQLTTDLTVTIPQVGSAPADGAYTDTVTLTVKPI